MRVGFISHSSAIAGAERALLELLPGLRDQGVEPLVVLPGEGPLRAKLELRDIEALVVPFTWWVSQSWLAGAGETPTLADHERQAEELAAVLRPWKLDVVYSNTSVICAGALAARRLGLAHLWHLHELNPYLLDRRELPGQRPHLAFDLGLERALGLIDALSERCVVTSRAMARAYRPYVSPRKTHVVYQAVTLDRPGGESTGARPAPPSSAPAAFRLIIVGTLLEWKRQEDAIRATAELLASGDRVELLILANGYDPDYRRLLEELVAQLGLGESVRFVEGVDPFRAIASSDCVVNCSRQEAFGRVTVEGMLLGKPIIGAASGATPELVRNRWSGYLYPPLDHRALAERVRVLCHNPVRCARMGRRGRRRALRLCSPERYARRVARVLHSCCRQRT